MFSYILYLVPYFVSIWSPLLVEIRASVLFFVTYQYYILLFKVCFLFPSLPKSHNFNIYTQLSVGQIAERCC